MSAIFYFNTTGSTIKPYILTATFNWSDIDNFTDFIYLLSIVNIVKER